MQKKNLSYSGIRGILLTSMILVPFIPFMLIMGLSFYSHKTSLESATIARMKRVVDDHRQMIENFLEERSRDIEYVINSYTFTELSEPENLKAVFERLKKVSVAFKDLGIFNAEGMHVSYHGPYQLEGRQYRDAEWFMEVIKNGVYISDVFMGYRQEPHFIIAIATGTGVKRWVIRTTIDTETFEKLVGGIHIGETGEAYIVNSSGVLQTNRRSGGSILSIATDNVKYSMSEEIDRQLHSTRREWRKLSLRHGTPQGWRLDPRGPAESHGSIRHALFHNLLVGSHFHSRRCGHYHRSLLHDRPYCQPFGKYALRKRESEPSAHRHQPFGGTRRDGGRFCA